jgi:hypothetical protein
MNKLTTAVFVAFAAAASMLCATAHAAQSGSASSLAQGTQAVASAGTGQPHGLTRKEVLQQLINAEKDGTMARLDSTIYVGG